jgi:hypothetical protein
MLTDPIISIQDDNELEREQLIEKTETENKSSCLSLSNMLIISQFTFNFVNMLLQAGYTTGSIVTDLAGFEPIFMGISKEAAVVALPIAVMFALAEANAHRSKSEHFNDSDHHHGHSHHVAHDVEAGAPTQARAPLSWKQCATVALHLGADIWEGAAVPIAFSKLAGADKASGLVRALSYAGAGLWSTLGSLQECRNTVTALREENARELRR